MPEPASILPGTLDLLILKAVSLGPEHGYGILLRIQQTSQGHLLIEQGALYPALYRLETKEFIASEWGQSDNNRKAKFYSLTPAGKKKLKEELSNWNRVVEGMTLALTAKAVAS
jgi:PadR family transcriptional regulator, regulatory protein PadR